MATSAARLEHWRYRLDRPVGGSGVGVVDVLIAELRDPDGREGMGFSYVLGGGGGDVAFAALRWLADGCLGDAVPHPRALHRRMRAAMNRTGGGPALLAAAALDVAAWDLVAKRAGQPLAVALGAVPDERGTPLYGSAGFRAGQPPDEAASVASAHAARGLRAVKPRASAAAGDTALLAAVAGVLPAGCGLMVDANERGDPLTAARLCSLAAEAGALFVEEPLPAPAVPALRSLGRRAPLPLAGGEHLQALDRFLPLLDGTLAVVQPDLAMVGGLTPCLDLCVLAGAHGATVAPHFLPGLFAHLAAAEPAVAWLEEFPLLEPLFDGWPEPTDDGLLAPGSRPGHGLGLAEGARSAFRVG